MTGKEAMPPKPGNSRIDAMRHAFHARFGDDLRFLRGLIETPKTVGAILPTGPVMAARMASVVRPDQPLRVLELGPGTGVITEAILKTGLVPEKLVCVEYSQDFARHLRQRYPAVTVLTGDAFALRHTLGAHADETFDCVVSALPLLNFTPEERSGLIDALLDRVPPGRPVIQFSYGPRSPVPPLRGRFTTERYDFVLRNVPPAQLWLFKRAAPL